MNFDYKYLQYLGIVIVTFFIIFVIVKTPLLNKNVIEGMINSNGTDTDKIPDAIKSNTSNIDDSLLITKYRKTYEDAIIDLEENVGKHMVDLVVKHGENISKDPTTEESQKNITIMNNLKIFKDALNETMQSLDKH